MDRTISAVEQDAEKMEIEPTRISFPKLLELLFTYLNTNLEIISENVDEETYEKILYKLFDMYILDLKIIIAPKNGKELSNSKIVNLKSTFEVIHFFWI